MNSSLLRSRLDRRRLVAASLAASVALGGHGRVRAQAKEVKIGYQKGSASLLVLKSGGQLESKLGELGYRVSWTEFPAALPLLEALNAGSVDFGNTGAAPVIFAQAAGTDLIYVLATTSSPRSQGIIVPPDSPIQTPADLKGKRVAAARGSVSVALLVRALETAGLEWGDAEAVYLLPADAKAAFEGGSVDAWTIWDPYYAAEEQATNARTIATNESVGLPSRGFYLAARSFVTENKEALATLTGALREADTWVGEHPQEVAKIVADETGIDVAIALKAEERRVYGIEPVTAEVIKDQQELADLFYQLQLIPDRVDVAQATIPNLDTIAAT